MSPLSSTPRPSADLSQEPSAVDQFLELCKQELEQEDKAWMERDDSGGSQKISNVKDKYGHQYVDLVLKGGGVWGIALVGFLYVLEENKIRFLRLAGASAGSIAATIMAAMGDPTQPKSKRLLAYLLDQDLSAFVDGHPLARMWLKAVTISSNIGTKVKITALLLLLLTIGSLTAWFFREALPISPIYSAYFLLIVVLIIALIIVPIFILWQRFNRAGMGINPGEQFLFWIRGILQKELGTDNYTTANLLQKATEYQGIEGLRVQVDDREIDAHEYLEQLKQEDNAITLITSELVTGNKVELPRMNELFLGPKRKSPFDDPAYMVRASMAIPFFFESFYIRDIQKQESAVQSAWKKFFGIDPSDIPTEARLVDGGLLSNFPISVYADTQPGSQRAHPILGVELMEAVDASAVSKKGSTPTTKLGYIPPAQWSILHFGSQMLSAARAHHDKAVLLRQQDLQKTIAAVPISDISWLKFALSPKEKAALFISGMTAAIKFLKEFEQNQTLETSLSVLSKANTPEGS